MLFLKHDGKLIEILRENFNSDKSYYNAIVNVYCVKIKTSNNNNDNYNYIKNLIIK